MKTKKPFTATALRLTLSLTLFVITVIAFGLFYLVDGQLQTTATDVSHSVVDASASQDNVQTLQQIQKELVADKDVIERASSIVADSQSYQYQDQILKDLNDYAGKAGIAITNIDFTASAPTGTTPSTPPTPGTKQPVAGVKSTSVSVTLKNPVPYKNMLQFIKSIEENLTKMQISKVSLSKDTATSDVTSEVLNIQVYVR